MVQSDAHPGTRTVADDEVPPRPRLHPLEPLTEDEIRAASAALYSHPDFPSSPGDAVFVSISLREPSRATLGETDVTGRPPARESTVVLYDRRHRQVIEAAVSLGDGGGGGDGTVLSWEVIPGARPKLTRRDFEAAVAAVKADPRWQAALRRRGVTDFSYVEIEPWPPGFTDEGDAAHGRRVAKALTWVGYAATDNPFARPVEHVVATVDLDEDVVLAVEDYEAVPVPPFAGNYIPELAADPQNFPVLTGSRDGLRPIEIRQPDGPSFVLEGHELRWQNWHLVVGYTPREGLVLHRVRYQDRGRERSIVDRASLSEMWVPYGDPAPVHRVKGVFDEGEAGLGSLANSLELGCDCLGEIRYLDAVVNDDQGQAHRIANAICIHEEDTGIGWKHTQLLGGSIEVRRGRRLVISSLATVGNYDYGFFWYLHTDGTIAYEVKLTGILSTGAMAEGQQPAHGATLAPGLYGPHHQHFFNVRLDVAIDGPTNSVFEVDAVPTGPGPDNPVGNAWVARETPLADETEAQRLADSAVGRFWVVANESVRNAQGRPVGYQLLPGPSALPPLQPDSPALQRALFATRHLWVTAYDPGEMYAAGSYPYQNPGGAGLPSFAGAGRPVRDADIVVWHTFVAHHVVRPEDWPVMPVTSVGFQFRPYGFFDSNPALDMPRPGEHCRSEPGPIDDGHQ